MPESIGTSPSVPADEKPDLLDQALVMLRSIVPSSWQIERRSVAAGSPEPGDDAVVDLVAGGQSLQILIEARRSFTARDVDTVLGGRIGAIRLFTGNLPVLIVAPWLGERTRQRIVEAGFNYADLAGNVRLLSLNSPPLLIDRTSKTGPPRARQSNPALRGPKAGRLVRLLADVSPPYGVLDVARAAEVTPGYVSRLFERLDRDALVERGRRGAVVAVDWTALIRRRAEFYSLLENNPVARFVCANGPGWALEAARDLRLRVLTLTGSFGAEQIVRVAAPSLLTLYATGDVGEFEALARLLPADEGANVMLITPQDPSAVARPSRWVTEPLPPAVPVAACSQLVLDCLSGPGRMPAEAETLLSWMADNEPRWRYASLDALSDQARR